MTPQQQHDVEEDEDEDKYSRPAFPMYTDEQAAPVATRTYTYVEGDRPDKAPPIDRRYQAPASPVDFYEVGIHTEEADHLSVEDARNGVIWAEIMGPPRSKRPYGQR